NEAYAFTDPDTGNVTFDATAVAFAGIEAFNDAVTVATCTFNGTPAADAFSLVNGPVISAAQSVTVGVNFQSVNVTRKTNLVTNGQNGADTFNLSASIQPAFLTALTLNGQNSTNSGDDNAA